MFKLSISQKHSFSLLSDIDKPRHLMDNNLMCFILFTCLHVDNDLKLLLL